MVTVLQEEHEHLLSYNGTLKLSSGTAFFFLWAMEFYINVTVLNSTALMSSN